MDDGPDPGLTHGLTDAEASKRLREQGYNELPSARKRRTLLTIALEVAREPMFLLLIAGGTIYLIVGEWSEALLLLSFVFVIMGITLYQERKAERTLEALRDLSSPRALVIREGVRKRIVGREVVPGDVLVLAEGDRVPADALVLSCTNLTVDESLLTGESVPVRKVACQDVNTEASRPGGDDLPSVFSGTLVVTGQGVALAQRTGAGSEIGKIGKSLQSVESEKTPLQKETGRLVLKLALVGLAISSIVVLVYGLTRGHWIDALLAGITLGMAVLPEEFPVVLTLFLALGAWRISKVRVLTRRAPTIETMGSTTVLCVDKTGTLTMNRMAVSRICVDGQSYDLAKQPADQLPEALHDIIEFSILASEKDPFDPMEKAFKELGERYLSRTEHLHRDWTLVGEYELSKKLLALSHVWNSPAGKEYVIAAKGAPEAIADLCHFHEEQRRVMSESLAAMADDGLRVLGVARSCFQPGVLPEDQHAFEFEYLGLVGLSDPVRPDVPASVRQCRTAGLRVVMITGDNPRTAQSVARQIGIPAEEVITGPEISAMDDAELTRRVSTTSIFARVTPEHKLRLVNALKANGEVVAMTGDGVNDAPALKSAHIGVAMGGRGTDVAREASSLVLMDDDFSSIVQAVKMGRRIFDNLRKAMAYILSVHIPIIGMSLIPVLLKWPLVLLPVQVVFLELIIDPACSLIFEAEAEEPDVMRRPPRNPGEAVFNRRTVIISVMQGLSVLLIVLAVYVVAMHRGGWTEGAAYGARAGAFTTLVLANLGLIMSNRSWSRTILATLRSPNTAMWGVLAGAVFFLGLVIYVQPLRDLFKFEVLHAADVLICVAAAAASILWFELFKVITRVTQRRPR